MAALGGELSDPSRAPKAFDSPLVAQRQIFHIRGLRSQILDPRIAKWLALSPRQSRNHNLVLISGLGAAGVRKSTVYELLQATTVVLSIAREFQQSLI